MAKWPETADKLLEIYFKSFACIEFANNNSTNNAIEFIHYTPYSSSYSIGLNLFPPL